MSTMENWNMRLLTAASFGDLEVIKLCLQNAADIDYKDVDGRTAFMWACRDGELGVLHLLLEEGCNKDITANNGSTALHLAAGSGHLHITRYLVEQAGISPLVTNHQGQTPYDRAAARKQFGEYEQVMEYLKKMSESILTKLIHLNRDDFQDLVALGTFASYENRVFLAGPCNTGKSSLASILIGEPIPKTWCSTDGLIIHFGRNGIDLQHRMMIPLKKGSGDILSKLLLGNPEVKEQETLQDEDNGEVTGDHGSSVSTKEHRSHQPIANLDHYKRLRQKTDRTSSMKSSGGNEKIPPENENLVGPQETSMHTAHPIQDDLLENFKKGTYIMNIAPSDLVDFGGQKSFDMTHQLFIQHKGTFILMFDGRKDLYTELEEYPPGNVTAASILVHWIDSVLTYCIKSDDKMPRIVFAATHSDSFTEDEKTKLVVTFEKQLTQLFCSHKLREHILYNKVFFINATDAANLEVDRLKDALVDIAFQQSTWGQQMPIVWVPLDLRISGMRADGIKIITKERLFEINKVNKEFALNERRVEDFLLVHHSIGKLIYFDEPALKDFIVIQPSAMVNILRAFITDKMFWPDNGPIRDILENLSSTGVLKRTHLFTLWSQPAFEDILTNGRIKDYVVQVLLHLDILVASKRYIEKNTTAEVFLVPCIVQSKCPHTMQNAATDDRTICMAFHLKETVVPSALSFKLIAAAITIWPLKEVDNRFCLYLQAAIMDADNKNEIQIHVKGQKINVYLINEVSKQHISPDLATTIQECLTLALGRILQFYSRCFGKHSYQVMSDLFEIEVGEVCNGKTCMIPLSDAKKQTHWKCKNGEIHETKYPLKWVFDKNKEHCDKNCEGLEKETKTLLLKPIDRHFVHLSKKLGIGDFYNFFIHLGMTKADYDNLNFRYFSNPMDMMLMGLFQWRDKTESEQSPATFGKLLKALKAIDRQHYLCQIHREDHSLVETAHSGLHDVPSVDVITLLTEEKMIGDCVVHLGIELGLSIGDIRETMHNFQRNLNGQIHDLLIKWYEKGKIKPTIFRLMQALKRVEAAEGFNFLKTIYGVK